MYGRADSIYWVCDMHECGVGEAMEGGMEESQERAGASQKGVLRKV